jgi:hypothetical protein
LPVPLSPVMSTEVAWLLTTFSISPRTSWMGPERPRISSPEKLFQALRR